MFEEKSELGKVAGGRRFDLWSKIEQKLHSPFSWMEKEKEIRRGKGEKRRKREKGEVKVVRRLVFSRRCVE